MLTGPSGEIICDFARSNLEVINDSAPVDEVLSLTDLRPHLHTIPALPDAVPYVTSYYTRRWGFCLPHRELEALRPGDNHAHIESEHVPGEINYGETVLEGQSTEEVMVSTYCCHPSLANNELSGPLAAVDLYRRIRGWPKRRFTYRFVVAPETIGSLVYLGERGEWFRTHMHAGLVMTCLGGENRPMSYKMCRREDSPACSISW